MKRNIITSLALAATLGLGAQTTNLVVEETNGTKTAIPTSEINGVLFEEAPEYTEANYMLKAVYGISGDNGTYSVDFGTDAPDENGDPSEMEGVQVTLQLVGSMSDDRYNAMIPEGYYRMGDPTKPFSIDINRSGLYQRVEEGNDGTVFMILTGAYVDVRRNPSGEYDIRMDLTTMDGRVFNLQFRGKIPFSISASEYESFTEDQNVTFDGGQERFYGNWFYPLADDGTLEFYNGTFNENHQQVDGYWLHIDAFYPKREDTSKAHSSIPDGEYVVDPRENVSEGCYNPFTFNPGKVVDFMGIEYNTGTWMTNVDSKGRCYIAMITGGAFTVSNNGTRIEFDFTASNGISIKGVYEGKVFIQSYVEKDKYPRPYSTLTEDHELEFSQQSVGMFYKYEPLAIGYNTFMFFITDIDTKNPKGDFIQLLVVTSDDTLENGTYTVSRTLGDNMVIPGGVDFGGQPRFSYYGNLELEDENGNQLQTAPIEGGTFTIADGPDGKKTVTFDFVDDGGLGPNKTAYKITGSWTGTVYNYDELYPDGKPALKRPAR